MAVEAENRQLHNTSIKYVILKSNQDIFNCMGTDTTKYTRCNEQIFIIGKTSHNILCHNHIIQLSNDGEICLYNGSRLKLDNPDNPANPDGNISSTLALHYNYLISLSNCLIIQKLLTTGEYIELRDYCLENGYIPNSNYLKNILKIRNTRYITKKQLNNIRRLVGLSYLFSHKSDHIFHITEYELNNQQLILNLGKSAKKCKMGYMPYLLIRIQSNIRRMLSNKKHNIQMYQFKRRLYDKYINQIIRIQKLFKLKLEEASRCPISLLDYNEININNRILIIDNGIWKYYNSIDIHNHLINYNGKDPITQEYYKFDVIIKFLRSFKNNPNITNLYIYDTSNITIYYFINKLSILLTYFNINYVEFYKNNPNIYDNLYTTTPKYLLKYISVARDIAQYFSVFEKVQRYMMYSMTLSSQTIYGFDDKQVIDILLMIINELYHIYYLYLMEYSYHPNSQSELYPTSRVDPYLKEILLYILT